jgi:Zn-dependent protease with chaperone function
MTRLPNFLAASWLVVFVLLVPAGWAQRTELDPGFNLFSPEQDIEMGRQVAQEAEQELNLVEDAPLAEYINRLGQQLATVAPFEDYPYRFSLVNDSNINAFALPGGFIYINRGILEAADREAEVAGVLGHEIAHVALRHGTNQASKAYIAQAPLAIFGGLFGGGSGVGSILTQLGIGFGANSLFLKFSRDAERQADLLGAQILFDAGYDPTGMTEFFEKLAAESGGRGSEFFSSHPNPGNRLEDVAEEIERLGPPRESYYANFSEFRRVKARLAELPEADPRPDDRTRNAGNEAPPELPSGRFQSYQSDAFRVAYPVNWEALGSDEGVTLAPQGGIAGANGSLAYGFLISTFEPSPNARGRLTLEDATDQLIESLRNANPSMRIGQGYRRDRIAGRTALSAIIRSESAFGGDERDWLKTAFGPDGRFYYFIAVVREAEFDAYEETFIRLFDSVRFR